MTVVARRRLGWRGARRSLSFMIGVALLALAASGSLAAGDRGAQPRQERSTTVASLTVTDRKTATEPAARQAPAEQPAQAPRAHAEPVAIHPVPLAAQATGAVAAARAPPA